MQPQPKQSKVLWILLGILLLLIIAFLIYYFFLINRTPEPTTTPTSRPSASATALQTKSPAATPTATVSAATYTDPTYKFTVTYPADWGTCKMKEAKLNGIEATYYVNCPTTDPNWAAGDELQFPGYFAPLAIGVYTQQQWQDMQNSGGPTDTLITQKNNLYYGWSQSNGQLPSDWPEKKWNESKNLISSFSI